MIITNSLSMLGPIIDMIWIGKLSTAAIAGVGVSGIVVMLVNGLIMGLFAGLRAMVARLVGAGDKEGANLVAQQGFVITAIFSIVIAIIGIFLAEPIMRLFGVEADVVSEGAAYMRILFAGMVTICVMMAAGSVMQASGDTVTPMKVTILFRAIHIALCPFLVFGWWIFPRLGVSGAALSNVISMGVGGSIGLWILFNGRTRLRLTLRNFRFDPNIIWRMVKIGIPASVTSMESGFANVVMIKFIAPFGTAALAAHSLIARIDMLILMPAIGLGLSSGVLAGQNLGAGQPERAERTGWLATILFTGVVLIASIVIWCWAENIVRIFNPEPGLVEIGSTFLRIEIISYLVYGPLMVLSQCITGVGDTMIPMITVLIGMWGVQVPLAYVLPRFTNLGVYGVRWAIVIAMVTRSIIYSAYFKLGRWKRKKV